jgi:hypothetical protein
MIYDEKRINDAEEKGEKRIVLDLQLEKKGRRLDVKRLKTQQSSGEMIKQGDSIIEVKDKVMRNFSFPDLTQMSSDESVMGELAKEMKNAGLVDYMDALNPDGREKIKELLHDENRSLPNIEWYEKFVFSEQLFRLMSLAGIITHYDASYGVMKGPIPQNKARDFLSQVFEV